MALFLRTCAGWVQRHLAWSNSRQAWQERLAALVLVLAACGLVAFGGRLSRSYQVVGWGLLLMALAALWRRGWLKLFGPVLFYDLVRTARRSRYIIVRVLYAFFLLLILYLVFLSVTRNDGYTVDATEMSRLGETFFFFFMLAQLVAVGFLTPAYTAGAIAEEKERKTLEFVLATDLRNREIVLSKLASRLANLTLIVLTGLPILSLTQFLGGVDPDLVLAGFAVTGLTMLSLASLSILNSVYVRKARDAIILTYLIAAAYLLLSWMPWLLKYYPSVWNFSLVGDSAPFTIGDLIEWLGAGNLGVAFFKLIQALEGRRALSDELVSVLGRYALFHGLAALGCCGVAVARLRTVGLQQTPDQAPKGRRVPRWRRRPKVSDRPMIWKEVFAEPGPRFSWLGRIIFGILILASFVPPIWLVIDYLLDNVYLSSPNGPSLRYGNAEEQLAENINVWVRSVGTMVAIIMLLAVAVRAASSISGERDRQTLDSLLTSPLESFSMLYAKWLGSVLCVRWGWVWLGVIWLTGMVTGGLSIVALPLLVLAWSVYAAFLAVLGLWFSTVSRTTLQATVGTLATTIGAAIGHWLIWLMIGLILEPSFNQGESLYWVFLFLYFGLTPPMALGWLAFRNEDFYRFGGGNQSEPWEFTEAAMMGLVFWSVAAVVMWVATSNRFRILACRAPLKRKTRIEAPAFSRDLDNPQ